MRVELQSEASECGIACLAMVSGHFGAYYELAELRKRFVVSLKGITLLTLTRYAAALSLNSRPLRLELDEVSKLKLPCILHWDLDHFVVLRKVGKKINGDAYFIIIDPAAGEKKVNISEMSKHFTGVAIELSPGDRFEKKKEINKVSLKKLTGPIFGLRRAIFQVVLLAVTLEAFSLALPLFNQFVVDEVILSGDIDLLKVLVIGFAILIATQTAISLARSWVLMRWGMDISLQWSVRVFRHLIHLPVSYFEKRHMGDIVSRFGSINSIQSTLTGVLVESGLDGLMAFMALGMMWTYSPQLTAVALFSIVSYALLRWAYYEPLRAASAERIVLSAKEASHFLETLRAITPIKLFGREDQRRTRWQNLRLDVQNRDIKTQKLAITAKVANSTIFAAQGLATFYLGAQLIINSELTVGMLMAFSSYSATFTSRVFNLIDMFVGYQMISLHSERLADIVHENAEIPDECFENTPQFEKSIILRDVKFRYAEGEPWILKGINLEINSGERIALVGVSGCGKTTLCKILLGLLKPTEGHIFLDGVPIEQIGIDAYRRIVGTVMQDDMLLSGSIQENITFFSDEKNNDAVEHAAKEASIHKEIISMPMGYNTLVGDMGNCLSGGQRQRILLARAFYRKPKILCLDEATSNLDVDNEEIILNKLQNYNVTTIMVAHRPEAIRRATRVVELTSGNISDDAASPNKNLYA